MTDRLTVRRIDKHTQPRLLTKKAFETFREITILLLLVRLALFFHEKRVGVHFLLPTVIFRDVLKQVRAGGDLHG